MSRAPMARDFDERANEAALSKTWDDWKITNLGHAPWEVVLIRWTRVEGQSKADALRRARLHSPAA